MTSGFNPVLSDVDVSKCESVCSKEDFKVVRTRLLLR
jgi:hypothetical protein